MKAARSGTMALRSATLRPATAPLFGGRSARHFSQSLPLSGSSPDFSSSSSSSSSPSASAAGRNEGEDSPILAGSGKREATSAPVSSSPCGAAGSEKKNLVGLTKDELRAELLGTLALEPYRVKQLWHWMYFRGKRAQHQRWPPSLSVSYRCCSQVVRVCVRVAGAQSFDEMGNVSKAIRTELAERYVLGWGQIVRDRTSSDGTRKWLLDFGGQQVESACAETICVAMDARHTITARSMLITDALSLSLSPHSHL
jgi:hypothetical protein